MSRVVAIIPARAGSVRLKGKNMKDLCGHPLIHYTIEAALKCDFLDEIIITTDSQDIIDYYDENYLEDPRILLIIRPEYLASSESPMWSVVEHACLDYFNDTIICLLQPTSPLRTSEDITSAWRLFELYQKKLGVGAVYWEYPLMEARWNGAIFIHYLGTIKNTKSFIHNGMVIYIMPKDRSVDIDTMEDFRECERVMKKRLETSG